MLYLYINLRRSRDGTLFVCLLPVGEMCFIPMNVHNQLFYGVRQLRWQQLSPVV